MADAEKLIRGWLDARFPDDRVVTETPADLELIPRLVKVTRAGGPKFLTLDRPRIVLDWFAIAAAPLTAREVARAWALEGTRAVEMELPHAQLDDEVWCTAVSVPTAPVFVPDANPLVRHFTSICSLTLRAAA